MTGPDMLRDTPGAVDDMTRRVVDVAGELGDRLTGGELTITPRDVMASLESVHLLHEAVETWERMLKMIVTNRAGLS